MPGLKLFHKFLHLNIDNGVEKMGEPQETSVKNDHKQTEITASKKIKINESTTKFEGIEREMLSAGHLFETVMANYPFTSDLNQVSLCFFVFLFCFLFF